MLEVLKNLIIFIVWPSLIASAVVGGKIKFVRIVEYFAHFSYLCFTVNAFWNVPHIAVRGSSLIRL